MSKNTVAYKPDTELGNCSFSAWVSTPSVHDGHNVEILWDEGMSGWRPVCDGVKIGGAKGDRSSTSLEWSVYEAEFAISAVRTPASAYQIGEQYDKPLQPALTSGQMSAVNSGITAADVSRLANLNGTNIKVNGNAGAKTISAAIAEKLSPYPFVGLEANDVYTLSSDAFPVQAVIGGETFTADSDGLLFWNLDGSTLEMMVDGPSAAIFDGVTGVFKQNTDVESLTFNGNNGVADSWPTATRSYGLNLRSYVNNTYTAIAGSTILVSGVIGAGGAMRDLWLQIDCSSISSDSDVPSLTWATAFDIFDGGSAAAVALVRGTVNAYHVVEYANGRFRVSKADGYYLRSQLYTKSETDELLNGKVPYRDGYSTPQYGLSLPFFVSGNISYTANGIKIYQPAIPTWGIPAIDVTLGFPMSSGSYILAYTDQLTPKADKVTGDNIENKLAALDANGNLKSSGKTVSDLEAADTLNAYDSGSSAWRFSDAPSGWTWTFVMEYSSGTWYTQFTNGPDFIDLSANGTEEDLVVQFSYNGGTYIACRSAPGYVLGPESASNPNFSKPLTFHNPLNELVMPKNPTQNQLAAAVKLLWAAFGGKING